jgi:hypothetical protein
MDNFFSLAINSQLCLYVKKKLETGVIRVDKKHGRPYLDYGVNFRVVKPRFRDESKPGALVGALGSDALLFTPPPALDKMKHHTLPPSDISTDLPICPLKVALKHWRLESLDRVVVQIGKRKPW